MNTTYFLNLVSGNLFKSKTDPGLPSTYYIGLSSTEPSEDGTNVTEPESAAGYSRVEMTGLSEPVNGEVKNSVAIDFDESTDEWGTMTHFVIYDAPTGGNLLMYGELSTSRSVEAGTIMTLKKESLKLSVKNIAVTV